MLFAGTQIRGTDMMRICNCFLSMAALFVVMFCDAPTTAAQIGGSRIQRPINTPAFSPYLNLFRSGDNSGPVLNYYGLVRPQLNAIEQGQQLGQGIQALQLQQAQGRQQVIPGMQGGYGYSQLGITGHPVVFQSYSNSGGGGGGFGGGGFSGGGFSGGSFGGAGGFSSGGLGGGFTQNAAIPGGGVGAVGRFGVSGMSGHPAAFGTYNNSGR